MVPGWPEWVSLGAAEVTGWALAAGRGDAEAAAGLVRATQVPVWRLCAALTDRSSADDLTQETYARAFRSLPGFAGESTALTWLLAIARRVCADHLRRRARQVPTVPLPDVGPARADAGDAVALRLLVAGLELERREAFVLTQLLGLSYAEAAEVCRCPVGTIRSRVARARDDLIRGLADEVTHGARPRAARARRTAGGRE